MARINIESEWWTDARRFALAEKLGGSTQQADGLAIEAWHISQEFWGNGKRQVPYFVFKQIKNHELLFEIDLAVKRDEVVYVRGTRQFHSWYADRKACSSKGGKSLRKSTEQTRSKQGSKRGANDEASSSSSSSPSSSSSNSEKEEYRERAESTDSNSSTPNILVKIWNTHRGILSECKSCTPGTRRYRSAQTRLIEMPDLTYWEDIVKRVAASSFCRGEKGERGWRADFDFLVRQETHVKVSEGKYDDLGKTTPRAKNEALILKVLEEEKMEREERERQRKGVAVGDQEAGFSSG